MKWGNIYSKRGKPLPDVYKYDDIPAPLRVQCVLILQRAVPKNFVNFYGEIHEFLKGEFGVHNIWKSHKTDWEQVHWYIENQQNTDRVIDAIEACFRSLAQKGDGSWFRQEHESKLRPSVAIEELNFRFRECGIGYRFDGGVIVRVDSEYMHAEVVRPALALLSYPAFEGASEEFISAHKHYRCGMYKECLADCLKAFESTMKSICELKAWPYDKDKDTASRLVDICFDNGLVPTYLQTHFSSLRAGLQSSVPTVRNREGGHGQGPSPSSVPNYMAAFLLNQTAATILMLVEASKEGT